VADEIWGLNLIFKIMTTDLERGFFNQYNNPHLKTVDRSFDKAARGKDRVEHLKGMTKEEVALFNKEIVNDWNGYRPDLRRDFLPAARKNLDVTTRQGDRGEVAYWEKRTETITRDVAKVNRLEGADNYVISNSNEAVALEFVILKAIQDCVWLGDEVTAFPASKYDDYFNGIDLVLRVHDSADNANTCELGIDVTTNMDEKKVWEKKLMPIEQRLRENRNYCVNYFKDINSADDGDKMGRVFMPRIIIGASAQEAARLAKLLVNEQGVGGEDWEPRVRNLILKEINAQLTAQASILLSNNRLINNIDEFIDPRELLLFLGNKLDKTGSEEENKVWQDKLDATGEAKRVWAMLAQYRRLLKYFVPKIKTSRGRPRKLELNSVDTLLSDPRLLLARRESEPAKKQSYVS